MTVEEIFAQFNNVYTDGQSELGNDELFVLLNKVLVKISNDRDWYWLISSHQENVVLGQDFIPLPTDFKKLYFNNERNGQLRAVLYVGPGNNPDVYEFVPKNKARQYQDINGFCYIDPQLKRIYFTRTPDKNDVASFEYVARIERVELEADIPNIPEDYHYALVHAMAEEYPMIEQMERQFSFARDNETKLEQILEDMRLEDANFKLNQ